MSESRRRALRVAILGIRGLPPIYGGAETATAEIGRRLAARGHRVTVYCRSHAYSERPPTWNGVDLVYLPSLHTKATDTVSHVFISALECIFRRRADVILLSGVGTSYIIPLLRVFGIEAVMWADGPDWKRTKWSRFGRWFLKLSTKFTCWVASEIVTDTTVAQRFYLEDLGRSTTYIPHGANLERPEVSTETLDRFGLRPDDYVLFVGRLIPEKGVHYLIEAFEKLETTHKLVIVGDDPYTRDYVESLRSTRDSRILFTGYVFGAGFDELMRHCRLYVQPSDVEGTSPVLVTAMSESKAIVVNAIPENLATVGETARTFRSGDVEGLRSQMAELVADDDLRQDLGRRARSRVESEFDWDRISLSFEQLFGKLSS